MDHSHLLFLVWLCLAFGGAGLVFTICDYLVARLMTPKDEVPTANPRVTLRRADLIEQDERLEELGIKRADPAGRSSREDRT
jgi:hypothetical protein